MKSFEVKALGLEELSAYDSLNTNGGLCALLPFILEGIIEWIIDPEGSKEDFQKGYDRFRK